VAAVSTVSADTDIAIIGGGPVGAALALALRDSALRVTVLESRGLAAQSPSVERGARPIALSHGSRLLLERLGAWHKLAPTPIEHIHVSQRGAFGRAAFHAGEAGVPALGYVVDYGEVSSALALAVRNAGCNYRDATCVTAVRAGEAHSFVEYTQAGAAATLCARLAVAADGGDIEGLGPVKGIAYGQVALTAIVRTTLPHHNTAYERFTRDGPLALLPLGERMALVWTLTPAQAELLSSDDETVFLTALRNAFGGRLGDFTAVTQRACYPLHLRYATQAAAGRLIAIGNAAQTLHPVAGQGFNLGLRDAWELAQMLRVLPAHALADARTLHRYRAARRVDRVATVGATHALVRLFSNDFFALGALRGTGMTLLGCVPPLRNFLARRMMFGARG
jgi:2-octaprenyl-6-methoxyphenol hydroxylase